jgi:hypothetical protein
MIPTKAPEDELYAPKTAVPRRARRVARGFGYVNNCLSAGVASLQARWIAH